MAVSGATFTPFEQIGQREQIIDAIYNVTPSETPLYSALPKEKATALNYEWQTDSLVTPSTNAQLFGDEATDSTIVATTRLNNRIQQSYVVNRIAGTDDRISTAGRDKETTYQRIKRGLELRTDMEVVLCTNQAASAGGRATAATLAGLPTWTTNIINFSTAPTGDGTDTLGELTDASSVTLTYSMISTIMTQCFTDGGNPNVMMLPPALKRAFSALQFSTNPSTADVRQNIRGAQGVVAVGTVEQWLSDFGLVDVVVNRQWARSGDTVMTRTIHLLDYENMCIAELQSIMVQPLAKSGDYTREQILSEYTLKVGSPVSNGAIYQVTP